MTSFTSIPNTEIAQDKPIKAETGLALRDNPIAIAEGGSGAPKIAKKIVSAQSPGGNVTITDLDDFAGVLVHGVVFSDDSGPSMTVEFSLNNASSFSGSVIVGQFNQQLRASFSFWLDFATGDFVSVGEFNSALRVTGTLVGSSVAITDLRFSCTDPFALLIEPNGGQSAT
ncbi:hypothetical protein [Roseovarius sp.]|uniref:hypothetical protein n=1 Tax=Roseovarius sp. TaxID=1486281 RepID=UPI003D0D4EA7